MSEQALNQMVGTALVDKDFCHKLLLNPAGASSRFDLTAQERRVLCDIRANSLEQLAQELCRWIESNTAGNGYRSLDEISKMHPLRRRECVRVNTSATKATAETHFGGAQGTLTIL